MAIVLTNGSINAGAYLLPGRKRPSLCVEQNGVIRVYGSFSNIDDANEFMDRLGELVGAYIDPRKEAQP